MVSRARSRQPSRYHIAMFVGRRIAFSLLMLAFVFAALFAYLRTRTVGRSLIAESHVVRVGGHGIFSFKTAEYWWTSESTLLWVDRIGAGPVSISRMDATNQTSVRLPSLESLAARSGDFANPAVSDDGKWILWNNSANVYYSGIDGANYYRSGLSWPVAWLDDSAHLLAVDNGHVRSVTSDSPGRALQYSASGPKSAKGCNVSGSWRYRITWAGSVDEDVDAATVEWMRIEPTSHRLLFDRVDKTHFPRHTKIYEVQVSPRGDWIAWLVASRQVTPIDALIQRVLPRAPIGGDACERVLISKPDGTNLHEIGSVPLDDNFPGERKLAGLKWQLDDRHLSFLYDGNMWLTSCGI